MKTIVIFGANSAMAKAFARLVAGPHVQLVLAGRHVDELQQTAADVVLRQQAPEPEVRSFDAMQTDTHAELIQSLGEKYEALDEVYLFFGTMAEQGQAQENFKLAQTDMLTNYVGAASLLEALARVMSRQKSGLLVGVSSVAGDRGRQSNYIYGSTKAAMTAYLQGLRNRLTRHGIHVMTVKPGLVATPMTSHLKPGLLMASPEQFAAALVRAAKKKKNTVYIPGFWKWIMLIIKSIPEPVFKRLNL